jgi:hypothetical protein
MDPATAPILAAKSKLSASSLKMSKQVQKESQVDADVWKVTAAFLTSSCVLVVAQVVARIRPARIAVSLLGAHLAALWWICTWSAMPGDARVIHPGSAEWVLLGIMRWLPMLFAIWWMISTIIDGWHYRSLLVRKIF